MLRRRQLAGALEAAREHLLQPGPQHLHDEHGLPVGHGEPRAVAVEHKHARVHVGAHVAAEERDGEGVRGGGFVGVVESGVLLVTMSTLGREEKKEGRTPWIA